MNNLQWKTSSCNKSSILFYNFPDESQKRISEFEERISKIEFQTCYVNIELSVDKVICLTQDKWLEKRESLCNELYPINAVNIMGITGTNGKTTTVDILRQLLIMKDISVLSIGTLGVYHNINKVDDFSLTTPDYIDLRKSLFEYPSQYALIEVSSHALKQNRFSKINFERTLWTSFSQDHLDYHGSMEEYFKAKSKIVDLTKKNLYIDDSDSDIYNKLKSKKIKIIKNRELETTEYFEVSYNRKNLRLALELLLDEGLSFSNEELKNLNQTPGRFNIFEKEKRKIIIDFAHTPDALINIGTELRLSFKDKRIITIFGCGGDRDRKKRPLMGEAACVFSDLVVLTSDNPRGENSLQIIKDIEIGCDKEKVIIEVDRAKAIKDSLRNNSNAIFLIAGKGHEAYIEINGVRNQYSDEEEVKRNLDDLP